MERVRWGILGVSSHFLLRAAAPVSRLDTVSLQGIASRTEAKAERAAEQWGIARSYGSYEELLADKDIDAVFISLPNYLHGEWIRKAADAGKHILCEKPLAMSAVEALESVEYARRRGVLLMEAFMYKFHPQWIRAAEIVRTGEIGAIHAIHTIFTYANTDPKNIRNQLAAGGGALRDIGCYAISASRFLLNSEPARVLSLMERDRVFETDILTSGILDFGAARALFTVGTQTAPAQEVAVYGAGGSIVVHLPFNTYPDVPATISVTTKLGTREVRLGPEDQYGQEFKAFSEALLRHEPAPNDPEDAIKNQLVLDALFQSEETGTWEPVCLDTNAE